MCANESEGAESYRNRINSHHPVDPAKQVREMREQTFAAVESSRNPGIAARIPSARNPAPHQSSWNGTRFGTISSFREDSFHMPIAPVSACRRSKSRARGVDYPLASVVGTVPGLSR